MIGLNKKGTIKRKDTSEVGFTESGDIKKSAETIIETNVPFRITKNDVYQTDKLDEASGWMTAKWLIFMNTGYNININDYLEDESNNYRYLVTWIDREPGGTTNHHIEVYVTDSRYQ